MGIKGRIHLFDNAINTDKIATDTVVPVDIDETANYNWTGASSTYTGHIAKLTKLGVATVGAANQFSGSISFPSGQTSTVVPNTSVTASCQIFYGFDTNASTAVNFWTSARSAGTSFTISASSAPGSNIVVNYLIVQ